MKLPYEEFVNRLYERGSQVRIVTAQGVHASLQENFRSSWRNWKGGLLTRCGHQLRCPNPTYARLFLFFFTQPSSCTFLFPLFLSTFRIFLIFFFFSLLQRINIKHLFIAPRNLLLVSLVRVHVNFVPSHSSFRSNCHKMTHRDTLQPASFIILRRVNNCANYLSTPSSRKKIKISFVHLLYLNLTITISAI